jgi:methylated-DNA-[protein]-cysteine S-methyltransferase
MRTMTAGMVTFDTPLGRCSVGWSDAGVTGVLLLVTDGGHGLAIEGDPDVPAFVTRAVESITETLAGGAPDLRPIPLDERGIDDWRRTVYAATRAIPAGSTRSYGELAKAIGRTDHEGARDVGAALARSPYPILVPCHRVLAANGALHGFSAPGGIATKRRMLELEGAPGFGQQRLFG